MSSYNEEVCVIVTTRMKYMRLFYVDAYKMALGRMPTEICMVNKIEF